MEAKNVMTVVANVYWLPIADQTQQVLDRAYSRSLDSAEQPYIRRTVVDSEWKPLDRGWIGEDCGLLIITNEEGKNLAAVPTTEQRDELAARLVEVGVQTAAGETVVGWRVLPGDCSLCQPAPGLLAVRCPGGKAQITITVLPR